MRDGAGTAGDCAEATSAGAADLTAAWRSTADIPRACSTCRDSSHASS